MIVVEPYWQVLEQEPGIIGMYKQIEYCGRISHKSEDGITEDSYKEFVKRMEKLQHFATFEHGTVYLKFIDEDYTPELKETIAFYEKNPYSKIKYYDWTYYVTTNYRVICENHREKDMQNWCEPTEHHERRHTVIFTCDIGVSREFNRHRVDSILEESTRYCNYTKDKFKSSLNVIIPIWIKERKEEFANKFFPAMFTEYCDDYVNERNYSKWNDIDYWLFANMCSEFCYNKLVNDFKWAPQQARTILPLDTKTTLAHTAFDSDWEHFFDLRALGTTGAPHPSAKELAEPLMKYFQKNNYI